MVRRGRMPDRTPPAEHAVARERQARPSLVVTL